MLDQSTRAAILKLQQQGHSIRGTARAMKLSRGAVRQVLRSTTERVPHLVRPEKATPYREQILHLYEHCKGNLVRVHEELLAAGAQLSYPALTGFCRRQGIGHERKLPVGEYHFEPGQEMQHDTSPHRVEIAGQLRLVQTASLVLCYSRMLFFQFFPTFTRFDCKVFLGEALQYFAGTCQICMIDNTHVVVLQGTGRDMVPVPEMAAFAERYGFRFQAHEKGDANRSAHVERSFSYIENNFLAGRSFQDWDDAKRQARAWCDQVNAAFRSKLKASPRELFAIERTYLQPLPIWVPPIYRLHQRLVDMAGYVSLDDNRYSVPDDFLGLRVEVRETKDRVEIYRGPRLIATHQRVLESTGRRYRLAEHHRPRGQGLKLKPSQACCEEKQLRERVPEIIPYLEALKTHHSGRATLALRRLLRMVQDYPRAPVLEAIETAARYGLFDLERVETIILRKLAREYFQLLP
ncbi:MAG: IS21 family transposase [Deltaproteobacteria bacterium]|nr:IS21 family transposase [Deltaproteobacteria bacterium]